MKLNSGVSPEGDCANAVNSGVSPEDGTAREDMTNFIKRTYANIVKNITRRRKPVHSRTQSVFL